MASQIVTLKPYRMTCPMTKNAVPKMMSPTGQRSSSVRMTRMSWRTM